MRIAQCRQSARLSLQSSELGPPPPHPQADGAPPFGSVRHTRLRERGWADPIQTRGHTLWCSMDIIPLRYLMVMVIELECSVRYQAVTAFRARIQEVDISETER